MGCCFSAVFPQTTRSLSYKTAKDILNTGDLIYFCNLGSVTSYFTIAATGYAVSHMGMIVKLENGTLGVLESVRHDESICDLVGTAAGTTHCGVRIVGLEEKLTLHGTVTSTPVYIQVLNVADERRPHLSAALKEFVRVVNCAPYTKDILCMCLAPTKSLLSDAVTGRASVPPTSFYCSELIAEAYKAMGLLPATVVSESVWPNVFLQNQLRLLGGASLDSEGFYCRAPQHRSEHRTRPQPQHRRVPPPLKSSNNNVLLVVSDE